MADDLDPAAVARAAEAMSDYLTMLGVDPDDVGEGVAAGTTAHVLARAALAAARDGEALSTLDLTITRAMIASRGWIGRDVASALVGEIERLTARGTAAPTVTAEQRAAVRAAIVDTIRDGVAWDGDAMADAALAALGIEVREP